MQKWVQTHSKHSLKCDGYYKTNRIYKRQTHKASRQRARKLLNY